MKEIDDLNGYAWECAIRNVYYVLNRYIGLEEPLNLRENTGCEEIARDLHIRFDIDGNII